MIYLDNAATSWPKPPAVIAAMERFLREYGANPGRSGHALSIQAGRVVYEARESVARLLSCDDPLAVAFTKNATEALNLALFGLLAPGDHTVTSCMEQNSVLRPLRFLQGRGVEVTRVKGASDGSLDAADVERAITARTKLIILTHASNVSGTLLPIEEVGAIARQRGILLCVDAAQTAGAYPLDMQSMKIDLVAFTGHKALYGPQGTGGLCIGERARGRIAPLLYGGTGSASESDIQPKFSPDCYEAGTLNAVGLAGLAAGIGFVESQGVAAIMQRERALTERLVAGLKAIPNVELYGPREINRRIGVISFNLADRSCSEVAAALEERAGICCRAGLHCAPLAHRQLGTFPHGTVRFSLGAFNNENDIDTALAALQEIAAREKGSKK